ncbi:MAG: hypothetical protein JWS10_3040 [Cypionkella sp.]|uniref:hypothetical protein n=1 Tax=Cypionkella sp. TaxID=2811411 RepID=UPI00262ABA02|nr:hypothetical protein [Cypionkella sp.]MDB5660425.1 hypothetical protein [Cypionkella sp.]
MAITATDKNGNRVDAYFVKGKIKGIDGKSAGFKCFPPSCNDATKARNFDTVSDAAKFLRGNPSWGIRMHPGSGIFTNILLDGLKR